MNNNKITLKEFFDSKDYLCIHCDTEEKANKLCSEFHKFGKTWISSNSYLEENNWNVFQDKTVYYNDYMYANKEYAEKYQHKIYEFEDVIL